jgi:hypothetical protein
MADKENFFMRVNHLLTCFLATASFCRFAGAAHWVLHSVGLNAREPYVVTGSASYGTPIQVSVPISSGIHGTGTFQFYGQTMATSAAYLGSLAGDGAEVTVGFQGSVAAYYTFVYQWASDSPSDVPPSPGEGELGVNGYNLARVASCGEVGDNGATYNGCSIFGYFAMLQGPTYNLSPGVYNGRPWPVTSQGPGSNYGSPPSTNNVSFSTPAGANLFAVIPFDVGSADISLSSGTTYATIAYAANFQCFQFLGGTWMDTESFDVNAGGSSESYIGCSQIGGLPVMPT